MVFAAAAGCVCCAGGKTKEMASDAKSSDGFRNSESSSTTSELFYYCTWDCETCHHVLSLSTENAGNVAVMMNMVTRARLGLIFSPGVSCLRLAHFSSRLSI